MKGKRTMEKRTNAMIAGVVAMFVFAVLCVFHAGCAEPCDCHDAVSVAVAAERVDAHLIISDLKNQITGLTLGQEEMAKKSKAGEECCQAAKVCAAKEQKDQCKTFIRVRELELLSGETKCLFVASWNQPAYYDPQGLDWNGTSYDGGYFPVLGRLSNGMIKTVEKWGAPEGMYTVIYFHEGSLAKDWKKTAYGIQEGNYDLKDTNVPFLCPIPAAAKKKATDKEEGDDSTGVES